MKNSLTTIGLGAGKIRQMSISENVDQKFIEDIFLKNLDKLKKIVEFENDDFSKDIYKSLIETKSLPFAINKHLELYILNNKNNLDKIFRYVVFRFKFLMCGKKKLNIGLFNNDK